MKILEGSRWGVNLEPVACPRCGTPHKPIGFRIPKSWAEFLWGGFTCKNCGCAFDKWGKERRS